MAFLTTGFLLVLLALGAQSDDGSDAVVGMVVLGPIIAVLICCGLIVCVCRLCGWLCCGRSSQNITVHNSMPVPESYGNFI